MILMLQLKSDKVRKTSIEISIAIFSFLILLPLFDSQSVLSALHNDFYLIYLRRCPRIDKKAGCLSSYALLRKHNTARDLSRLFWCNCIPLHFYNGSLTVYSFIIRTAIKNIRHFRFYRFSYRVACDSILYDFRFLRKPLLRPIRYFNKNQHYGNLN